MAPSIFALVLMVALTSSATQAESFSNLIENEELDLIESKSYPSSTLDLVRLGSINPKNYLFSKNQYMTWMAARSFCRDFDMDLVSIETSRENDLLVGYISSLGMTSTYFWTSGNKIGRGVYMWLNGESMSFEDWEVGQPSNVATEHCQAIYNNHWHDYDCTQTSVSFICEERI